MLLLDGFRKVSRGDQMEAIQKQSDGNLVTRLFFRLLPIQVLLAAISAVNDMVSSLFASNSVGAAAMSAIGYYNPINMLLGAVCAMLVCGSQILCGKLMGANQMEHTHSVFTMDLMITTVFAIFYVILHLVAVPFGWMGFFTKDPEVRTYLDQYVLGKTIGIIPFILGQQLAAFLSLENRVKRTTAASVVFIVVNLVASYLFVSRLKMQAFGIALASSCGLWAFLIVELSFYLSGKSIMKLRLKHMKRSDLGEILKVGVPGALTNGYQALRHLIVNGLLTAYVGSAALSASATVNSFLGLFWAIPAGMLTVSRMLMSVYIGEEDRKSLTDVMRNMFKWSLPLMSAIVALIVILAEPITNLYYHDPSMSVYKMTVWGMRLMSVVMPIAVIEMHFMGYAQASDKQVLSHIYAVVDGVIGVVGLSFILVPIMSINGYYVANILNSAIVIIISLVYACIKKRQIPKNMDQLMVIPKGFGVSEDDRMDLTVRSMDEVVAVSESVFEFCKSKGIDEKRTYYSSLFLEEMAGNVVDHGFHKDKKKHHSIDIRVVKKGDDLILRIKDDCVPFNPEERKDMFNPDAGPKNMGIKIVYGLAKKIEYQNILGLNVLTIKI